MAKFDSIVFIFLIVIITERILYAIKKDCSLLDAMNEIQICLFSYVIQFFILVEIGRN